MRYSADTINSPSTFFRSLCSSCYKKYDVRSRLLFLPNAAEFESPFLGSGSPTPFARRETGGTWRRRKASNDDDDDETNNTGRRRRNASLRRGHRLRASLQPAPCMRRRRSVPSVRGRRVPRCVHPSALDQASERPFCRLACGRIVRTSTSTT